MKKRLHKATTPLWKDLRSINKTGQYKESAEWYRKYTEERIKWRNECLNW